MLLIFLASSAQARFLTVEEKKEWAKKSCAWFLKDKKRAPRYEACLEEQYHYAPFGTYD